MVFFEVNLLILLSSPLISRKLSRRSTTKQLRNLHYALLYARLCEDLCNNLPPYPPKEQGAKAMTFRDTLSNTCQNAFYVREIRNGMLNLRFLGNIRFVGELLKFQVISESVVLDVIKVHCRLL
ncbi:hypothetical protein RND81_06G174000 [Saponaria officinalis]|uniref:MIF4G domain-containing protein n=1 Tax=Saponaria officinalis TaxID=3572 RepID=A0AAW1KCS3_SAPOF